jgi:hypothetical protein
LTFDKNVKEFDVIFLTEELTESDGLLSVLKWMEYIEGSDPAGDTPSSS